MRFKNQARLLRYKEPDHSHFLVNEANAYDPAELCCGQDAATTRRKLALGLKVSAKFHRPAHFAHICQA